MRSFYTHVDRTDVRRSQDVPSDEQDKVTGLPMRKFWEPVYVARVGRVLYSDRRKTFNLEGDRIPMMPS
jgi:hypothetical protein